MTAECVEPIKVVFWDLDGTVWDGTLQEDAPELTTPRKHVKALILDLDGRGVLNAVVSQASQSAAESRLVVAGLNHAFVSSRYGVVSKASAIAGTLRELNLLPGNAAFVDDLPFHRAEVSELLPEVWAVSPSNLTEFAGSQRLPARSALGPARRLSYQIESLRRGEETAFAGNRRDFLASCAMRMVCSEAPEGSPEEERVTELLTRAHRMSSAPLGGTDGRFVTLSASLVDRFGEYGIVAGARVAGSLCTNLAISCRVQARGVLEAFLKWMTVWASERCPSCPLGLHTATTSDVNLPMRMALRLCGFSAASGVGCPAGAGRETLVLVKPDRLAVPEWISLSTGR